MNWEALRELRAQGYAPRTLLDVGAHIGAFSSSFVEMFPGCTPVLVEPNPHCALPLAKLPYETHAFAASHEQGEAELHLTSEWLQSTGASLYRENTHFFRDEVLQKIRVPRRRLDDVFAGRRFDVVKIDTQGAELDVLRGGRTVLSQSDFLLIEVSLVDYNAGGAKAEEVFAELTSMGFQCSGVLEFHRLKGVANGSLLQMDFIFENRARKADAAPGAPKTILDLAAQLRAQGDAEMSSLVLRQAAGLVPVDPAAIEALAGQDLAHGDVASALGLLLRLRTIAPGHPGIVRLLQVAMSSAAERIHAHMSKQEWDAASSIATPLARLLPGYAPAQHAAMIGCAKLSDAEGAGEFARSLLALDPSNLEAERIDWRARIVAQSGPKETEPARYAMFPPQGRHALLTLRDFHDAVTAILCGDLQTSDLPRLVAYLAEARDLVVDVPGASDLPGWLKHYRLAMDAMDPAGFAEPLPQTTPVAPPAFAASSGEVLSQVEFLRRIGDLEPSAVFFAAADVKYIGLYAGHYIDSIQQKCNVPHAIVLHVIGGAGHLADVARSLNRPGANVVLTGDDFDSGAVTTKCFDTPPKGQFPHPAAHFQSARFQWLGWLMQAVNRPIFVSDIDLLLQRGVADLLDREAQSDIVLNENEASANAGSRLTANLLLLNPTPAASLFVAGLKFYLDRHLSRPEVSRWIDQFGLLMARHRLRREAPAARIGYFDTTSDINNVMYRTFESNPFRFLSLYHGFDMTSLDRAA